jgi:hypothetical protein
MNKRQLQPWYLHGKKINYDFSRIKELRGLIKVLKSNNSYYAECIYDLQTCASIEKEISELTTQLKNLNSSIEPLKHEEFLNWWRVIGRAGFGVNYIAMGNCREQINSLIKAEFIILAKEVQIQIEKIEQKIKEQHDLITLTRSHSAPIIAQYQVKIDTEQSKIAVLEAQLQLEIAKLKIILKQS